MTGATYAEEASAVAIAPRRAAAGLVRLELLLAAAAFAVLCFVALRTTPMLVEPDDYAYRASVVAMTEGHFLTLSTAQAHALAAKASGPLGPLFGPQAGLPQWVQLADGRWISEKDPGYPFLAVAFQALGIIRLAALFYGALACIGLYIGARRWLGRFGGTAAVGLYCSSGTAIVFAWRDYMPTFFDASLIAAGAGALLWAVLATEASRRRRTWAGLAGFVALEVATFTRYTDIVVLGCAVVAVIIAWRLPATRLAGTTLAWWLGSAVVFCAGVGGFDSVVYGGPLQSGYRPGEIQFSLSAVLPNLKNMPRDLAWTTPMYLLALVAFGWILGQWLLRRHSEGERATAARRDLGVGLALGASWLAIWGLYFAYTWTVGPGSAVTIFVLPLVRFYVPALGLISLLGAWLVTRLPGRGALAGVAVAVVVAVLFGLGIHSFDVMTTSARGAFHVMQGPCRLPARPARAGATRSRPGQVPAGLVRGCPKPVVKGTGPSPRGQHP
ncbi:MAG TPA: hypothetical protein VLX31_00885 [Streptosporangiaceae bacterium]|nr:hypothetical protein [Streptosporangiaceae bacterium]